jgi:hypothetical protein
MNLVADLTSRSRRSNHRQFYSGDRRLEMYGPLGGMVKVPFAEKAAVGAARELPQLPSAVPRSHFVYGGRSWGLSRAAPRVRDGRLRSQIIRCVARRGVDPRCAGPNVAGYEGRDYQNCPRADERHHVGGLTP